MQPRLPCLSMAALMVVVSLGPGLVTAPAAAGEPRLSIVGQVRTERGQIIPTQVTVVLETYDGSRIAERQADSQGQFEFPNLVRVHYTLLVRADGFYPLQEGVAPLDSGQVISVRLIMTRRPQSQQASGTLPPLTDMNLSKKARKAFEKGLRQLDTANLPAARKSFEAAVAEYPCYARAQTGLAAVLSATREPRAAEAALRKAIQCDPGFPDAYAALGQVLSGENRFPESEAVLEQGLRLSPKAWQIYDKLAAAHYSMRQYAKAEQEWLQVRSLNPQPPPDLHAKLAAVYVEEGMNDKAYAEMQAYLDADAKGRFAPQIKMLMDRIKSTDKDAAHSATAVPRPPGN